MSFWGNVCAYALALFSGSPVSKFFQQESLTGPSLYFPQDHRLGNPDGLQVIPVDVDTKFRASSYNSEFWTAEQCNGPKDRQKWCGNTDIHTDYEDVPLVPNTGVTHKITLEITSGNEYCGDGYCRDTTLINGTYPGPLIRGSWGDMFEITILNSLKNCNGTSFHWHGIRQLNTVWEDGVAGVTQCPIPPGKRQTYRWRATQYGTSWYHSHFSLQYANGIAGPLIIDGPTSKNYHFDNGPLMLTDWYHGDAFSLYHNEVNATPPASFLFPPSNLVNGEGNFTTVSEDGKTVSFGCKRGEPNCYPELASIFTTVIKPSQSRNDPTLYKYRIINMSVTKHYSFWIDGHDFWVVATDFVPVVPAKFKYLNVAIGQRYDIIIEAHAKEMIDKEFKGNPNFWIKTRLCDHYCVGDPCVGSKPCAYEECRQAILSYDGSSEKSPDSNKRFSFAPSARCIDPPAEKLKPVVKRDLSLDGIHDIMKFDDPFEVDRRVGTQNYTEVFGRPYGDRRTSSERGEGHVRARALEGKHEHDGPIPPPGFKKPSDKLKPHIWDFGSSKTSAMHPNGSYVSFMIDWGNATLGLAAQGIPSNTWNPRFVPIVLDDADVAKKWAIFAITGNWRPDENHGMTPEGAIPGAAHPIHLHGHDFVILASGTEPFIYNQPYELVLDNPVRRDVALLPANGYLIIGFRIDNPGTWLMHCHIAWHASSGLALQWVERPKEIPALMSSKPGVYQEFVERCKDWREHEHKKCEWKKGYLAEQDDSGI